MGKKPPKIDHIPSQFFQSACTNPANSAQKPHTQIRSPRARATWELHGSHARPRTPDTITKQD